MAIGCVSYSKRRRVLKLGVQTAFDSQPTEGFGHGAENGNGFDAGSSGVAEGFEQTTESESEVVGGDDGHLGARRRAAHLGGEFGKIADALERGNQDLSDGGHVDQFVEACHFRARPYFALVTKNLVIPEDTVAVCDDELSLVIDAVAHWHAPDATLGSRSKQSFECTAESCHLPNFCYRNHSLC